MIWMGWGIWVEVGDIDGLADTDGVSDMDEGVGEDMDERLGI